MDRPRNPQNLLLVLGLDSAGFPWPSPARVAEIAPPPEDIRAIAADLGPRPLPEILELLELPELGSLSIVTGREGLVLAGRLVETTAPEAWSALILPRAANLPPSLGSAVARALRGVGHGRVVLYELGGPLRVIAEERRTLILGAPTVADVVAHVAPTIRARAVA